MNDKLSKHWSDFETQKDSFRKLLDQFSAESQLRQTSESDWNARQVLEHVINSEKGTLAYMMKKTSSGWQQIPIAGEEHSENSNKLDAALESDKKWKAPDVLADPSGDRSLDEMFVYWDGLREKYQRFLSAMDENFYERQIFRHPFSGRMNLWHTMNFLTKHIAHHEHQIKRILNSLSS